MLFTAENILLVGSILLFVSIIVGKTGYRFGGSRLVTFFLWWACFSAATDSDCNSTTPKKAQFIGMVALSIILFSGGMDTKFTEIKPILSPRYRTVHFRCAADGAVYRTVYMVAVGYELDQYPPAAHHLPAAGFHHVVYGLGIGIRHPALTEHESEAEPPAHARAGKRKQRPDGLYADCRTYPAHPVLGYGCFADSFSFVIQFVVGAAAGYLLGKLAILMLNRLNIDNQSLYPILLLSFVFFTFSITDLMKGNGYLAVYIAGMMVGNNKIMPQGDLHVYGWTDMAFPDYHVPLSRSAGEPARNAEVAVVALLIGVFMIVIGRPLSVFLCLLPFGKRINMKSRLFVSWVGIARARFPLSSLPIR